MGLYLSKGMCLFLYLDQCLGGFTYGCEIKSEPASSAVQKELVFRLELWKVCGLPAPLSEFLPPLKDRLHVFLRKCGLCVSRRLSSFC